MIRQRFLVTAFVGAVLGGVAVFSVSRAGSGQTSPTPQDEVRELRQRVEKLEARVAELEQLVPRVVVPAEGVPQLRIVPDKTLDGRAVPKGWVPREFNGQRYYDIPLDSPQQRK
jgi:hypothetical protein